MKEFACCFTGHRQLPADKAEEIVTALDREIENLIAKGITDFISGGALGFDQIAASIIIGKREMGENIRLIFALPCRNQDVGWSDKQRTLYQNLIKKADKIVYVSEEYNPFCMKRRNYYMVDHSSHCVCALLRERTGTSQTVAYARRKGLQIINVAN